MELSNLDRIVELRKELNELNEVTPTMVGILSACNQVQFSMRIGSQIAVPVTSPLFKGTVTGMVDGIIRQVGSIIDDMVELGVVIDSDDNIIAITSKPDPKFISLNCLERNKRDIMLGAFDE